MQYGHSVPDSMNNPFYFSKVQDVFAACSAPKHPNLFSSKFAHKMIDYSLHSYT